MAKLEDLTIDIHTNIKRDVHMFATNDEILDALRKVMKIPDNIIGLKLDLTLDNVPQVTYTQCAEKE